MKWPTELLLIRHAESAYNILRSKKNADAEYVRFKELVKSDRRNPELRAMAEMLSARYALGHSDRETPITPKGEAQARAVGRGLRAAGEACPDVIFVSPYLRTEQTLALMTKEWPELAEAKVYREERIREKDHGLALLYNDQEIYFVMHSGQRELYELLGDYDYRYLNGENIPDVRERNLSWIATLTREFSGKRVMAITHHLTILSTRANFERLGPEEFLHLDEHEKPLNCSVTKYIGKPELGSQGRLILENYNQTFKY